MRAAIAARCLAIMLVGLVPFGFSAGEAASQTVKARPAPSAKAVRKIDHGSVYLLRGLANIFSLGMDTLGEELRSKGVDATVVNHAHAFALADKLAARYKTDKSVLPVVIIGHSLGANKALTMSARLAEKGVPVRLVVLFDPTASLPVPRNVAEVINLHNPRSIGVPVKGVPGYRGKIENRDVSKGGFGHISIDKSSKLHAEVVDDVLRVLREQRGRR